MESKRVLVVNEVSYLNTGYATYFRNVIPYLREHFEVAELSVYAQEEDKRLESIPWKTYPNIPRDPKKLEQYHSSPVNQFGAYRFEKTCLDFKPDTILGIRDIWMESFIPHSPYKHVFNWVFMPTCDASSQSKEWLYTMSQADRLFAYTKFAKRTIESESNLKVHEVATPAASYDYCPAAKAPIRLSLGLDPDAFIVGTVMRNQRRKLFPELFESFSKFAQDKDVYLLCHTSYPDMGWDFPELLEKYGIYNKVIFTYVCKECKHIEICKFNDSIKQCGNCMKFACLPANVEHGLEVKDLARVYQSMDVYLQPANSGGLEMPAMEAASCGIPIGVTNYSGMEDYVTELDAEPIMPINFVKELETGCNRATLNIDSMVRVMNHFYEMGDKRQEYGEQLAKKVREKYTWKKVADKWIKHIHELPKANWKKPARICRFEEPPQFRRNSDYVSWLMTNYLPGDGIYGYDWCNMVRDLNFGMFKNNTGGYFYSDMSVFSNARSTPFDRKMASDLVRQRGEKNNFFEKARAGQLVIE